MTYSVLPLLILIATLAPHIFALWPIPRNMQTGNEPLLLAENFDIVLTISQADMPGDLLNAIQQSMNRLKSDNLERLVVGRGASDAHLLASAKSLQLLTLSIDSEGGHPVESIASEVIKNTSVRSESYILRIPAEGTSATITANTTLGLFRGLSTFEQFWYQYEEKVYTLDAPVSIVDTPAYPYRAFMLDTARNFFPVSYIQHTLDAMSWVKLNTLYWHAVDSQSFPLEVAIFPNLSSAGAYSTNFIYTEDDVQNIITYAAERGIDVVLELDTPGHETAVGEAYPEHVACFQASPWSDFASEPPAGQLRLANPSTINFTTTLVEYVSKKFKSSMFSTGGDEVNDNCYTQDAITQANLMANNQTLAEALTMFLHSLQSVLIEGGKRPLIKEDMLLKHNTTVDPSTIIVVWISSADAQAVAARNFSMIHQPSDYFYLDCGGGEWIGDDIDGNSWCDPFKTWQRIYSFDPLANLTSDQVTLVLGGQIPLWTEQSGPQNMDSIVWPRAAAAAEVFWTGATLPDGSPRNVSSALPRLHDVRFRMVQRGVDAIPLQPEWCAIRPGACDLNA